MNLQTIARIYVLAVALDEKAQGDAPQIQEDVSCLRAEIHALLMTTLRQAGISFSNRAEAAHLAFEIVQGKTLSA